MLSSIAAVLGHPGSLFAGFLTTKRTVHSLSIKQSRTRSARRPSSSTTHVDTPWSVAAEEEGQKATSTSTKLVARLPPPVFDGPRCQPPATCVTKRHCQHSRVKPSLAIVAAPGLLRQHGTAADRSSTSEGYTVGTQRATGGGDIRARTLPALPG